MFFISVFHCMCIMLCVIGSSCNKEQLREMAGAVNRTRLSLLELIKQNKVDLLCWDDDCFKDNLESYFYKQIDYQFIA